jgi:hypothetical protein
MRRLVKHGILTVALALILSSTAQPSQLSASAPSRVLATNSVTIDKGLTGMTWDGKEFISSYGINSVPLINISLDGSKVTRFAPSFVGVDEVYAAISQGKAGFPDGYLYVNSGPSIYEINPNGSSVRLFSSPPGAGRASYVAFDTVGTWGYVLFALDDNGLLWSIKSDGTAKVLGNFSSFANAQSSQFGGLKPEGIAVAPQSFGAYGGYLLITLEGAGSVLALPPSDTSKVTIIAQFNGEEPERVLQIPPRSDLYVAEFDTGAMSMVPAANFSNYVDSMLVVTEGEGQPSGTFNVLKATGNNVTVTRIGSVAGNPHFEGTSFVPTAASVAGTQSVTASQAAVVGGVTTAILIGGVALLVAVVVLAVFFVSRRGKSSPPQASKE